jgi:hypothetical protein
MNAGSICLRESRMWEIHPSGALGRAVTKLLIERAVKDGSQS